jgi:hypothetical protein
MDCRLLNNLLKGFENWKDFSEREGGAGELNNINKHLYIFY